MLLDSDYVRRNLISPQAFGKCAPRCAVDRYRRPGVLGSLLTGDSWDKPWLSRVGLLRLSLTSVTYRGGGGRCILRVVVPCSTIPNTSATPRARAKVRTCLASGVTASAPAKPWRVRNERDLASDATVKPMDCSRPLKRSSRAKNVGVLIDRMDHTQRRRRRKIRNPHWRIWDWHGLQVRWRPHRGHWNRKRSRISLVAPQGFHGAIHIAVWTGHFCREASAAHSRRPRIGCLTNSHPPLWPLLPLILLQELSDLKVWVIQARWSRIASFPYSHAKETT
jgi:hypothetical protein